MSQNRRRNRGVEDSSDSDVAESPEAQVVVMESSHGSDFIVAKFKWMAASVGGAVKSGLAAIALKCRKAPRTSESGR